MQLAEQQTTIFNITDFFDAYLETGDTGGSGVIGPDGGIITVTDPASPIFGTTLKIPEGALDAPVRISIAAGDHTCDFGLTPSLKLLPDGLQFKRPAILTIHLKDTGCGMEDGFEEMLPAVYQYDNALDDWTLESAARLERFGESVLCELDHL